MHIPMPPNWFNPHGLKMNLGGEPIINVLSTNMLLISSSAARVQIYPFGPGNYKVIWRIIFFRGEIVRGEIHLKRDQLKDAFGISGKRAVLPSETALKFEAEDFVQGRYVRKGSFLNIPMPGTGMDGDPNVSIFVNDEIKEAVRELVKL